MIVNLAPTSLSERCGKATAGSVFAHWYKAPRVSSSPLNEGLANIEHPLQQQMCGARLHLQLLVCGKVSRLLVSLVPTDHVGAPFSLASSTSVSPSAAAALV
jgi:hypothetical protein